MKKHNYPGLFIAFEGLDGSGSSTQVDLLAKRLSSSGLYAFATKEPTNNMIGGLIRAALTKSWSPSPECLQLLYTADRAHHLQREVVPALEKGNIMITDRYFFSTVAFGSINLDKKWLLEINSKFILPDITFFVRVSPKECIRRIGKSRNEFELFEEEKKLAKVLKAYDELAQEDYGFVVINGDKNIRQIEEEVYIHIAKKIAKKDGKLRHKEKNLFNL